MKPSHPDELMKTDPPGSAPFDRESLPLNSGSAHMMIPETGPPEPAERLGWSRANWPTTMAPWEKPAMTNRSPGQLLSSLVTWLYRSVSPALTAACSLFTAAVKTDGSWLTR